MNLLWSYAYALAHNTDVGKEIDSFGVPSIRFFADSGAHSARTLGIHLDTDAYAAWLRKWSAQFTIYANLDSIWAPATTWANQKRLEDHGLHPMPVFHTGEPWSWLERYLENGYTYIALGKLLGQPWTKLRPWLAKAFRIAGDTAVFHGFGLTRLDALREFPFYSVDSSSWTAVYRYGRLNLFDGGRWRGVNLRSKADVLANRRLLDDYGVSLRHLSATGFSRGGVGEVSAASFIRAANHYADQHGPIALPPGKGYPPGRRAPGIQTADQAGRFHLYLAESGAREHRFHARTIRRLHDLGDDGFDMRGWS